MLKLYGFTALLCLLVSCSFFETKEEVEETGGAEEPMEQKGDSYRISLESTVNWYGSQPLSGKGHNGSFEIEQGRVYIDGDSITGGFFVMHMGSMKMNDSETSERNKLMEHLFAVDFFDTLNYAESRFDITSIEKLENDPEENTHLISGNLKMKDTTNNVTFPAKINLQPSLLTATANFNIDRTRWGIHYNSKESLGDKFISPEVEIALDIIGAK